MWRYIVVSWNEPVLHDKTYAASHILTLHYSHVSRETMSSRQEAQRKNCYFTTLFLQNYGSNKFQAILNK